MTTGDADIRDRLRHAREAAIKGGERVAAGRAKIADGTAEPIVYEALKATYTRAGTGPTHLSASLTGYAESLVLDALDAARRDGAKATADTVSAAAAPKLRKAVDFLPAIQMLANVARAPAVRIPEALTRPTPEPKPIDLPAMIREATKPSRRTRALNLVLKLAGFTAAVITILVGLQALHVI
jgi:hypothetical protein